ncbi:MAG TPA: Rv2175c family DNA-binding protein [Actinophytocola sp.]|uniref:Rv2175c family DNA-binding protein n=1 Tax=Actinophytocola sp. TaxID=1872138 RepID=UPI002DDCCDF9|nr:Rv2175c family DNA-binding protein [Actinophytocola sp.]HEV2782960.1 Rv2175c family DNA-binding protein [Actinophytocola sp.]
MSQIPAAEDVLDPAVEVLTLPETAQRLGLPVTRVQQALRDGHLIAIRRGSELVVPTAFLTDDGAIVKGLPGTITVLTDSGFTRDEIVRWLFTADDSLPGTPIEALRTNRGTEVKRRAQALAF